MSKNLRSQFPKLELVAEAKPKYRKVLLEMFAGDPLFYKAIRELVKNTINKNISLNDEEKKRLRRYKRHLISFGKKNKSPRKRRNLVLQTGTGVFIPLILPLASAIISSLIK